MAGDQTRKRELLCNLLHLMAEAWRGKDAAPEVVEKYAATSKDLVASDWGGGLSAAQHKTLNQFAQFESLRERFK